MYRDVLIGAVEDAARTSVLKRIKEEGLLA